MKLKIASIVPFSMLLSACSFHSFESTDPLVGTCHEFSYNKKYSIPTYITLPLKGSITSTSSSIYIDIRSTLSIIGYPDLICKGQQIKSQNQKVLAIGLTCEGGLFGTAFIDLIRDKNDVGNGQFSLSNQAYGTFQLGQALLMNFQF